MAKQIMSRKKSHAIATAIFLVGLAIITYIHSWWPSIMLVIGLSVAVRQYLLGKHFDMFVSIIVFLGVFITVQFNINWQVVLPVLFIVGAIYIFFREFFMKEPVSEEEREENITKEIEEEEHKTHKDLK